MRPHGGPGLHLLDFGRGFAMGGGENALVTLEAFKIYGGQVHAVEAIFEVRPLNTPSGWGERTGA